MPKPKTTLASRPIDDNEKILAFLAEESEAKDIIAASVQAESAPEQPKKTAVKSISEPMANRTSSSLSQLLQSGEDAAAQGGMVKRNFSVSRSNMNYIKRVVQIASNAGVKKTQDDVLNEILEDWFKSHGW